MLFKIFLQRTPQFRITEWIILFLHFRLLKIESENIVEFILGSQHNLDCKGHYRKGKLQTNFSHEYRCKKMSNLQPNPVIFKNRYPS
jgi:hypothetical protein